LNEQLIEVCS